MLPSGNFVSILLKAQPLCRKIYPNYAAKVGPRERRRKDKRIWLTIRMNMTWDLCRILGIEGLGKQKMP